jgi:hypothetical protein
MRAASGDSDGARGGIPMRRLVLLCCALAATLAVIVAPAAQAHSGEFHLKSARLSVLGAVVVTGTLTCQAPGFYNVEVFLTQTDQGLREGSGTDSGQCSSSGNTQWTQTIVGTGPFYPGQADAHLIGESCQQEGATLHCVPDEQIRSVTVQG